MLRATIVALGVAAFLGGTMSTASAGAPDPGPAFSTEASERADALDCPTDLSGATRDPVLLIHGTVLEPDANFDWNWQPALDADGVPWCTVALRDNGMGDLQDSAEFVVHAIRTMAAEAGRPVDIVGYSQGGMIGRWALKWWPDTRDLVDDLVGLASSNHGAVPADVLCALPCAVAVRQQTTTSAFITALNEGGETFAGIDYTVVYSRYDEVAAPNLDEATGVSPLRSGDGAITNVQTQQLCPLSLAEHIALGTYDPVAYAVARDALDHDGPADVGRFDPATCLEPFMPGVAPLTFATDLAAFTAVIAETLATSPLVTDEPPLRCYVTDSCVPADGGDEVDGPDPSDVASAPTPGSGPSVALPATGGTTPTWLIVVVGAVALGGLALARRGGGA